VSRFTGALGIRPSKGGPEQRAAILTKAAR